MSDTTTDRLQALEDRAEIIQLVARYGPAVDDHDYDTLGSLYTEDSVFDSVGGAQRGRGAVVAYYRERAGDFGATYHYPHSTEVYLDGPDDAHGVVCGHAELSIDGHTHRVAMRYHDTYKREGGAWRFHERNVKLLYVLNLGDQATGLSELDRVRWPDRARETAMLGSDLS